MNVPEHSLGNTKYVHFLCQFPDVCRVLTFAHAERMTTTANIAAAAYVIAEWAALDWPPVANTLWLQRERAHVHLEIVTPLTTLFLHPVLPSDEQPRTIGSAAHNIVIHRVK